MSDRRTDGKGDGATRGNTGRRREAMSQTALLQNESIEKENDDDDDDANNDVDNNGESK